MRVIVIVAHLNRRLGFTVAVLAVLLMFLQTATAFAALEIAYDDGSAEGGDSAKAGEYRAVRFSLPQGLASAKLIRARFYKVPSQDDTPVRIHVLGSDGVTELTLPFQVDLLNENAWNDADLSSKNIIVTGDFYIVVEWLTDYDPKIGFDTSNPDSRSYAGSPGSWVDFDLGRDLMIRAVVSTASVGGVVLPTNTLAVLAPYVAIIGLVVGTVVAEKGFF